MEVGHRIHRRSGMQEAQQLVRSHNFATISSLAVNPEVVPESDHSDLLRATSSTHTQMSRSGSRAVQSPESELAAVPVCQQDLTSLARWHQFRRGKESASS
ncbi:hypothetical protein ONS96_000665 [Cadophora gregata f. sp. sojae]|nr:hypothetical protein ONS96_000665 [Cadophora gregata f. sp. sojae]